MPLCHKLKEQALGHYGVGYVEPCELALLSAYLDSVPYRQKPHLVQTVHDPIIKRTVHLELQRTHGVCDALKRILYLGVPSAVQGSMFSLSNIIIQAAINSFGSVIVAAWTAIGKFDGLYWITSNAMATAICTFVGQNFGAGQYERMRKGVRMWLVTDLIVTACLSVLLLSLAPYALRIFSSDPVVIDHARQMMWYFAPFYVLWVCIDILSNVLRGAGDSIRPMIISLLGVCVLRILWIVFVVPHWHSVAGVSVSYPFTWGVTALVFLIYYKKSNWLERCRAVER